MKVKEESEKVGLKLNIQKTKIMASGPITSWEIDEVTVETVSDFIFLGSNYFFGMWETRVRSLGQEDPLKKEMATHPVLLPGEFHGQRSLVGYSTWSHKELDMTE